MNLSVRSTPGGVFADRFKHEVGYKSIFNNIELLLYLFILTISDFVLLHVQRKFIQVLIISD